MRGILDSTSASTDFYDTFDKVVATNPHLTKTITEVRNETNLFLCEVLQYYPYRDLALVQIKDTNKKELAYLTHEILSDTVSITCMGNGVVGTDKKYGTYIKPYDKIYGVIGKVRWANTEDKNCLFCCVNIRQDNSLTNDTGVGEIKLNVDESSIHLTKDWISIETPNLYVNGLPYNKPELENYYNKTDTGIIVSSLNDTINVVDGKTETNDNGVVQEYSFTDLQTLIDNAKTGDVLRLNGLYKFNEKTDNKNGVNLNKNITIVGGDYCCIDGDGKARCLKVTGSVVLKNIVLKNGYLENGNGGGLFVTKNSSIVLENIIFEENKVYNGNGGGAYMETNIIISMDNCIFKRNEAIRESELEWSLFKKGMGGAFIINKGSSININNTLFTDNKSYTGFILIVSYNDNNELDISNVHIKDCEFRNNQTNNSLIYFDEYSTGEVVNCDFINNKTIESNGTVVVESSNNFSIANCLFKNNTGFRGACIHVRKGNTNDTVNTVNVFNCSFIENNGTDSSGVYLGSVTEANIVGCVFKGNNKALISNSGSTGIIVSGCDFLTVNDTYNLSSSSVVNNCYKKT